uniref:AlNc14C5G733 protein n=1 Tax=Albugo laibachii Nc14 TaxID=890382 RepID=F0W0U8_9STRA|nr:AlNc14C5G733 [Albugo laibachii Nc14]|eukprot:CCA14672.1 AlNc14C5G733 [Albugo laibachii Nc14]
MPYRNPPGLLRNLCFTSTNSAAQYQFGIDFNCHFYRILSRTIPKQYHKMILAMIATIVRHSGSNLALKVFKRFAFVLPTGTPHSNIDSPTI